MSEIVNATCYICGKGYHKCHSCKDMELKPWKAVVDTSEHYKVFEILKGYYLKIYDAKEAWDKLQAVNLSDMDGFKENVKEQINDIMENAKKMSKAKVANNHQPVLKKDKDDGDAKDNDGK